MAVVPVVYRIQCIVIFIRYTRVRKNGLSKLVFVKLTNLFIVYKVHRFYNTYITHSVYIYYSCVLRVRTLRKLYVLQD